MQNICNFLLICDIEFLIFLFFCEIEIITIVSYTKKPYFLYSVKLYMSVQVSSKWPSSSNFKCNKWERNICSTYIFFWNSQVSRKSVVFHKLDFDTFIFQDLLTPSQNVSSTVKNFYVTLMKVFTYPQMWFQPCTHVSCNFIPFIGLC